MCSSVVPPGPQVLTNTPLESAAQSKEGHVSQRMLEHYSHVRMDAKRKALDALSRGADGTKRVTNGVEGVLPSPQVVENIGGDDGIRTRDLMRDRSGASSHSLQYLLSSHWLTPFQGICFRSKLIPFPAN